MNHPTVTLAYFGETVEIDQEVAPLLQDVWRLGIPTLSSCQDDDGMVELMFYGEHALRFLDVVSYGAPHDDAADDDPLEFGMLFWRIAPSESLTFDSDRRWRYHTSVWRSLPDHRIRFTTSVRFPRDDLPTVTRIFRDAALAYRDEEQGGE